MNAQLKGISMQLSSMNTQTQVMESMGTATKVMQKVNKDMNIQEISAMMKDFQKEQMKAEIAGEQIQDAMDMGADVEGEADDVYNQILGEIGMDMQGAAVGMGGIASAQAQQQPAAAQQNNEEMDELEARLAQL